MRFRALALVVAVTVGCDRLLGIEDLPRASTPAFTYKSPACGTCYDTKCREAKAKCLADDRCEALHACVAQCDVNDPKCRLACEEAHAVAAQQPSWIALDACGRRHCLGQCLGTGGLIAGIEANCACADGDCAAKVQACVQSGMDVDGDAGASPTKVGACERRLACLSSRANPDGWVECRTLHPEGGVEVEALLDCARKSTCSTTCSLGTGQVACAGNFVYGTQPADSVTFGLGVEDKNGKRLKGAPVVACLAGNCAKCTSVAEDPTDEAGWAQLELPMPVGSRNYGGCLRVTAPPDAPTADPFLPTAVFPGRRIRFNEAILETLLLLRSDVIFYGGIVEKDVNPSLGVIIGVVQDCIFWRILGAKVRLEPTPTNPDFVFAYIDGDLPAPSATSTVGRAAFAALNVPPGRYTVVAEKDGREVVRSEIEVMAGTLTDATVYPKPR